MKKVIQTVYRIFDDHEEKHYLMSSLTHKRLEKLFEQYKGKKEKVYAKEFITFLHKHDPKAEEVEVKDFYF
jgi:D-mannonate dehydratase